MLPMLCTNESNEFEPHLARDCTVALACLASCILPLEIIPSVLESVASVAKSSSWKAKAAVLEMLEVWGQPCCCLYSFVFISIRICCSYWSKMT